MMITQFALAFSDEFFSAERVTEAGIVTLQGMLTIFAVLAILWLAVEIMHLFFRKDQKEKSKPVKSKPAKSPEVEQPAAVPNEQDAAIAAAIAASLAAYEDSGATVAAITAAITAARADEGETGAFRVVSFKRAASATRRRRV